MIFTESNIYANGVLEIPTMLCPILHVGISYNVILKETDVPILKFKVFS